MHLQTLLKLNLRHLLGTEVLNKGTNLYHCPCCMTSLAAEICDCLSWCRRMAQGFLSAYDPALKQSYFCWSLGPKHSEVDGFSDQASK